MKRMAAPAATVIVSLSILLAGVSLAATPVSAPHQSSAAAASTAAVGDPPDPAELKAERAALRAARSYVRPAPPAVKPPTVRRTTKKAATTRRYASVPVHYGTAYLYAMAKCIRSHESGVYTRNTGNGYYGAYQIGDPMWHKQTHLPGHASDYSKAVQDYWFMRIWSKLKTDAVRYAQWPTYRYCSYIRP